MQTQPEVLMQHRLRIIKQLLIQIAKLIDVRITESGSASFQYPRRGSPKYLMQFKIDIY